MTHAIAFMATAYCLRGTMASGQRVREGVVAADPRVLPLLSYIRILQFGRRRFLVGDTGSLIKGRHIDIWMRSCPAAIRWGVRTVQVRLSR